MTGPTHGTRSRLRSIVDKVRSRRDLRKAFVVGPEHDLRCRHDSQRLRVHDEIKMRRIVGIDVEMMPDEMRSLVLFVVDAFRRFVSAEPLCLPQMLDPSTSRFDDQNTKCAFRRECVGGATAQDHAQPAFRKGAEDAQKLSVVLRFSVVRVPIESVVNEAFDRISHPLIQAFDEIPGNVLLSGNLVDDLAAKETKIKLLRYEPAEFGSLRAGKPRESDTRTISGAAHPGLVMGPALDLTIDHLIEGLGSGASHSVTSELFIQV